MIDKLVEEELQGMRARAGRGRVNQPISISHAERELMKKINEIIDEVNSR